MGGSAACWLVLAAFASGMAANASGLAANGSGPGCRQVTLVGEVARGHGFAAPLGEGLEFYLQPIASGWIVRVVPADARAVDPDYAEVATPPYRSVTPLSLSTDFSFRAQDAVGWNPRRFHFASGPAAYRALVALYRQLPSDGSRASAKLQDELVQRVAAATRAELQILDAALVPGSANQGQAAAVVSSPLDGTAHTLSSVPGVDGSPLGALLRIRFRLLVDLPLSFHPAAELQPAGRCTPIF